MTGKNKRLLLVGAFALALALLLIAEPAHADNVEIGVGGGVIHAENTIIHKLGYSWDDKWTLQYERYGGNALDDVHDAFSIDRYVYYKKERKWSPYLSVGYKYWDDPVRELVDSRHTYSLGIGLKIYDVGIIGVIHSSTAGLSSPNKGIDYVHITFRL